MSNESTALIVGLALLAMCCAGAYASYRDARRNKWGLDNGQLIARYFLVAILPLGGLLALAAIMARV